jgi:hypothetical protein
MGVEWSKHIYITWFMIIYKKILSFLCFYYDMIKISCAH